MRLLIKILLCLASSLACVGCSEHGLGRDPIQFLGKAAEGSFDPPSRWFDDAAHTQPR